MVTPHAAQRWAERIDHAKNPKSPIAITKATQAVLSACEVAKTTHRYRDKSRVMVTAEGVHLIVRPGGVVVSVLSPGQWVTRCTCMHCIGAQTKRARGEGN